MMKKTLLVIILIFLPSLSFADNSVFWQGGLWNLDYPGDISTYGYFRLSSETDVRFNDSYILKVEWIERLDSKGERLYASLLIPELGAFIVDRKMTAEMGEVPSIILIKNSKKQEILLRLWEPTRYSFKEIIKKP